MIHGPKTGLFAAALRWYVARKLRTSFRGLWVRGQLPSSEGGLVVYPNHSSFWDGFVLHALSVHAGWDAHAVMEEENLRRYRFHTALGAFSVRRGDPVSALQTLRYARRLLQQRPRATVFVFPQGEIRPANAPLGPLERGVEVLARAAQVRCVPLAIRYTFFEHEFPDVLLEAGTPHAPLPLPELAERLSEVTARLNAATSLDGFSPILQGQAGVAARWDAVRGRSLFLKP
jgi:1-acyl-sn-glycerol-3-phosphate acyltransferase